MKKLIALLLMLMLIVASAVSCSCRGKDPDNGKGEGGSENGGEGGEKDPTDPDVENTPPDKSTVDEDGWTKFD